MALTESEINFNYNQAISKVNEINAVNSDLDKAIEDLDVTISLIKNNWEGNNSRSFLTKCSKERQKIADTKQEIIKAANTIKNMAEEIKKAELNALAIARAQEAARAAAAAAAASAGASAGTSVSGSVSGTSSSSGVSAMASGAAAGAAAGKNVSSKPTVQKKNIKILNSMPTSVINAITRNSSSGKASKSKR